jgi:hypothetical protein
MVWRSSYEELDVETRTRVSNRSPSSRSATARPAKFHDPGGPSTGTGNAGVRVGVAVGVFVGVCVGVFVGVCVEVFVGVCVGVFVGVCVGVGGGFISKKIVVPAAQVSRALQSVAELSQVEAVHPLPEQSPAHAAHSFMALKHP